jgi:hypothetical protein
MVGGPLWQPASYPASETPRAPPSSLSSLSFLCFSHIFSLFPSEILLFKLSFKFLEFFSRYYPYIFGVSLNSTDVIFGNHVFCLTIIRTFEDSLSSGSYVIIRILCLKLSDHSLLYHSADYPLYFLMKSLKHSLNLIQDVDTGER